MRWHVYIFNEDGVCETFTYGENFTEEDVMDAIDDLLTRRPGKRYIELTKLVRGWEVEQRGTP